jgi:hypothetical protein
MTPAPLLRRVGPSGMGLWISSRVEEWRLVVLAEGDVTVEEGCSVDSSLAVRQPRMLSCSLGR